MEINLIAISVQMIGTLLVAAILWMLTRIIGGMYFRYWAAGWVILTAALISLRIGVSDGLPRWAEYTSLILYCQGEYLFGYLLWAGFRNFSRGLTLQRTDLWLMGPLAISGVATPLVFPTLSGMLPFHSPLFALFYALSLGETLRYKPVEGRPVVGLYVARIMLLILTILFLQYGIVVYWAVYIAGFHQDDAPIYLQLSPVFDAIGELGLAFGMLLMAMERIRQELEDKNQQLADATRQLAHAARTDVLTGLLNRRGYEELAADKATQDYSGSVVMIDVNNLKPLNDTYGHAAGDAALQLVARALRVYFRVTDPLFRTGGDEFLVILPGGNEQDVISRMLRIDDALTGQRLPGVDHALDLGIAWGVAEFRTGSDLPIAVDKADRAMYVQKQGSKSRSAEI